MDDFQDITAIEAEDILLQLTVQLERAQPWFYQVADIQSA